MKSVGEVMAIGRTFAESLQKALRGLETGLTGLDEIEIDGLGEPATTRTRCRAALGTPTPDRLLQVVAQALRLGLIDRRDLHLPAAYEPVVPAPDRGICRRGGQGARARPARRRLRAALG